MITHGRRPRHAYIFRDETHFALGCGGSSCCCAYDTRVFDRQTMMMICAQFDRSNNERLMAINVTFRALIGGINISTTFRAPRLSLRPLVHSKLRLTWDVLMYVCLIHAANQGIDSSQYEGLLLAEKIDFSQRCVYLLRIARYIRISIVFCFSFEKRAR